MEASVKLRVWLLSGLLFCTPALAGNVPNVDGSVSQQIIPYINGKPVSITNPLPITGGGGGGGGGVSVTYSAPAGAPFAVPTTAATAIPAGTYQSIRYVVQGSSGASGCVSFFSSAVSISGSTCVNGYPIFPGSSEVRTVAAGVMPTTPLTAIAASAGTLTITYETQ